MSTDKVWAAFAGGFMTIACSTALADEISLNPASYFGEVGTNAGGPGDDRKSTTGPSIVLSSTSSAINYGFIDPDGPWLGPQTNADAGINISSESDNGVLTASSTASAPTQPIINSPDVESYSYQASALAESSGELAYDLYITGPTPTVGVLVNATSTMSGSGQDFADLKDVLRSSFTLGSIISDELNITYGYGGGVISGLGNYYYSGDAVGGYSGGFKEDGVYFLNTNQLYQISLTVSSNSYAATETNGDRFGASVVPGGEISGSVSLDPTYEIAAGTPNADQYNIFLSLGVSNSPSGSVPEPSTWMTMLIGFAGVSYAGHARRRARLSSPLPARFVPLAKR